jgi:hypothetical protein
MRLTISELEKMDKTGAKNLKLFKGAHRARLIGGIVVPRYLFSPWYFHPIVACPR